MIPGIVASRIGGSAPPITYNSYQASPVPGGTSSGTLSNSNRRWTTNTPGNSGLINANYYTPVGSMPAGKKAYFELTVVQVLATGTGYIYFNVGSSYIWYVYSSPNAQIVGTNTTTISAATAGMVLMFAVDDVNGRIWYGRNGTWLSTGTGTANPAANTGPAATFTPGSAPAIGIQGRTGGSAGSPTQQIVDCNFGHAAWAYTPPAGFGSINA